MYYVNEASSRHDPECPVCARFSAPDPLPGGSTHREK